MDIYDRVYAACAPLRSKTQWSVSVQANDTDWSSLAPDPEVSRAQTILDDAEHAAIKATGSNVKVCGSPTKDGGTITIHWRDGSSAGDPCREAVEFM